MKEKFQYLWKGNWINIAEREIEEAYEFLKQQNVYVASEMVLDFLSQTYESWLTKEPDAYRIDPETVLIPFKGEPIYFKGKWGLVLDFYHGKYVILWIDKTETTLTMKELQTVVIE